MPIISPAEAHIKLMFLPFSLIAECEAWREICQLEGVPTETGVQPASEFFRNKKTQTINLPRYVTFKAALRTGVCGLLLEV